MDCNQVCTQVQDNNEEEIELHIREVLQEELEAIKEAYETNNKNL